MKKNCTQHGFAKIGAFVLNLNIGILINICATLNICTSNSPTSASPKTLSAILKQHSITSNFNENISNCKSIFCQKNEQDK